MEGTNTELGAKNRDEGSAPFCPLTLTTGFTKVELLYKIIISHFSRTFIAPGLVITEPANAVLGLLTFENDATDVLLENGINEFLPTSFPPKICKTNHLNEDMDTALQLTI